MQLHFYGAAGEVTGSCTLVDTGQTRFLVDCGMFQGGKEAYTKNLNGLDFGHDVRRIDFVLLTHAHIDHSGLLPRLAVLGYRGPIYTTPASIDLLRVLLPDSAHIQEKELEWQVRHQRRGHKIGERIREPLYTVTAALSALKLLKPVRYGETLTPANDIQVRFHNAAHILGSAWLEIIVNQDGKEHKLVFSGDLGMNDRPILNDLEKVIPQADTVLIESTYGDRMHRSMQETEDEIVDAIKQTQAAGGNLIIPSFAVGRTQEVIYILADLVRRGRIASLDIYVDSPMANEATRITMAHPELLDRGTHELIAWLQENPEKVSVGLVADVEESKALNRVREGAVIISASGMCEAGRIKYHLRENLPRRECGILIVGFQAVGTLGRRLVDGAPTVRIFGEIVPVRARIYTVGGLSAHADQCALLNWLRGFREPPANVFVTHGEAGSSARFAEAVRDQLGWSNVHLPRQGEQFTL